MNKIIAKDLSRFLRLFNTKHYKLTFSKINDKHFVNFYSLVFSKISKILSRFGFKVSFKPFSKIQFSSAKDPIPTENQCGNYFISCPSSKLGYSNRKRRWLKARRDGHLKVKNENIYIFIHFFLYLYVIRQRTLLY